MHTQSAPGVINPSELYTLKAFKQRLGVQDSTLRAARRAGLRVLYIHKQGYILGKDWIDYVLGASNTLTNVDRSIANSANSSGSIGE